MSVHGFAQQTITPIQSNYKDWMFSDKGYTSNQTGDFLPVSQAQYDIEPQLKDSSKQYYDVTHILFQTHLFEIKGEDYKITIDPVINFSTGKDLNDTNERKLFQNTRGVYVNVNLFKNFSFFTSFYENQGRYANYQGEYYSALGELYPGFKTYKTQNAVIPGAARTKPFKEDGFDYAFAVGAISYRPIKQLEFMAGNNPQFIGAGHRSILLSDNSGNAPYFRANWFINNKFYYTYLRSRYMNLLRRPVTSSVESYYESKGYSVNYFTYKPLSNISISLFEGTLWNRGDSLRSQFSNPLIYNPIPFISKAIGGDMVSSMNGLNVRATLLDNHTIYGQLAMHNYDADQLAFQIGYRGYNYFNIPNLMLQAEVNVIPDSIYNDVNQRLNYSHYNAPIAHIKGQGFSELLLRASYEWNRLYINQQVSYYQLNNYHMKSLLPIVQELEREKGSVMYNRTELGYRFNRKMNLAIFGAYEFRNNSNDDRSYSIVQIGIKSGFINSYTGF